LTIIPQCKEDTDGALFENWIYTFAEQRGIELYVNYPQQVEAFPISFEDPFSVYKIEPNNQTGMFSVRKYRQDKNEEQFRIYCNGLRHRLED